MDLRLGAALPPLGSAGRLERRWAAGMEVVGRRWRVAAEEWSALSHAHTHSRSRQRFNNLNRFAHEYLCFSRSVVLCVYVCCVVACVRFVKHIACFE